MHSLGAHTAVSVMSRSRSLSPQGRTALFRSQPRLMPTDAALGTIALPQEVLHRTSRAE
eukprot:m.16973 g.16973  ORF g.16973 m.16973 type:complete len:59 (+) comp10628_c0_seq6:71-247(+)